MDRNRYRSLFVEEARRRIAEGEALLSAPEGARADGFAIACHTLKGMCGQMGYARPHAIAHAMEELCDALKRGQIGVDPALLALLGEGFSTIAQIVNAIEQGLDPDEETEGGETGLEARIRAHLRVSGTTAFAFLLDTEPAAEAPAVDRPRGDEAIGAIADLMAAVRRVRSLTEGNAAVALEVQRMQSAIRSIFTRLVELRQVTFDTLVPSLRRQVRGVANHHQKSVQFEVRGETTLVDAPVLAALQACLAQLINNAVVHGIEPSEERRRLGKPRAGRITVAVERVGDRLSLEFSDDGAGFDEDALRAKANEPMGDARSIAARPGMTTSKEVGAHAGRGQGLGAILHAVEQIDGTVEIHSEPGRGCRFVISMPSATRPAEVLLVQAGGHTLGLPTRVLARTAPVNGVGAPALLGLPVTGPAVVALRDGGLRTVDRVIGKVEALVTPPPFPINRLPRVTGSTVGPDGKILFVVDPTPPPTPGAPR